MDRLKLSDYAGSSEMGVDVLVGADYYFSFMSGGCIKGHKPNSPIALESRIGWVLTGPYRSPNFESNLSITTLSAVHSFEECLDNTLSKFWEVESIGSPEENVFDQYKENVEFDGGIYVTKLPFKLHHEILPDNFQLSKNRLISLRGKPDKDPELFNNYDQIFNEYEENNIIEKVQEEDVPDPGNIHYLPHRAVVRHVKTTTKVRPVFDASAKVEGVSLNDCLYSGPNLLSMIFDILLRFRTNKIALISDIRQAFLNIGIHPDHVNYLRFLWFSETGEIVTYRFLRVLFRLTCIPFLLQGTLRHHCEKMVSLDQIDLEFIDTFLENLYVGDNVSGVDTVSDGLRFYKTAKWLMKSAGFELRKWCSNNTELMSLIQKEECCNNSSSVHNKWEDETSFSTYQLETSHSDETSVLGIKWDVVADNFVFDLTDIIGKAETIKLTKRNILKVSASFYDPLGILSLLCKEKIFVPSRSNYQKMARIY